MAGLRQAVAAAGGRARPPRASSGRRSRSTRGPAAGGRAEWSPTAPVRERMRSTSTSLAPPVPQDDRDPAVRSGSGLVTAPAGPRPPARLPAASRGRGGSATRARAADRRRGCPSRAAGCAAPRSRCVPGAWRASSARSRTAVCAEWPAPASSTVLPAHSPSRRSRGCRARSLLERRSPGAGMPPSPRVFGFP